MNRDVGTPAARPQPRDRGTSLVEVMTAMFVMTIVMAAVGTVAVLGLKVSGRLTDRIDNVQTAQSGMAAVTKMLRTAVLPSQLVDQECADCADTAIVTATPARVAFYANVDNTGQGPSFVIYEVLADPSRAGTSMLRQTLVPPRTLSDGRYSFCDPTVAGCVSIKRVVARGLGASGVSAFTFYDYKNSAIASTSLTREDLARVSSVEVTLRVALYGAANKRSKPNTLIQRVSLPNADVTTLIDDRD